MNIIGVTIFKFFLVLIHGFSFYEIRTLSKARLIGLQVVQFSHSVSGKIECDWSFLVSSHILF